jgi:glutaconate CoA-transferase subunit A
VQKETVLASARSIVTVEEIVDELVPRPGGVVLPSWTIDAVALAPGGAHPSYAHGFYERDNAFYLAWDPIARDRERFTEWIRRHVLETENVEQYRASLREAGLVA